MQPDYIRFTSDTFTEPDLGNLMAGHVIMVFRVTDRWGVLLYAYGGAHRGDTPQGTIVYWTITTQDTAAWTMPPGFYKWVDVPNMVALGEMIVDAESR